MKFKLFWVMPMLMLPAITVPLITTSCSEIKEEIQEIIVENKYEQYKNYVNKTVNAHIKINNNTETIKCLVEIVNENGVQLKKLDNSSLDSTFYVWTQIEKLVIVEDNNTTMPDNDQNQGNNNENGSTTPGTPDNGGTGTSGDGETGTNPDTGIGNGTPGTDQGGGGTTTPNYEEQYKKHEGKTADITIGDGTTNNTIPCYILKVLKDGVYIVTANSQTMFYEWNLVKSIVDKDYPPKVNDMV